MAIKEIHYPAGTNLEWVANSTERSDMEEYVNALPRGIRKNGKRILKKIFHLLQLNEDGQIIYDNDEATGSYLIDLLSYLLGKKGKYRKPVDFDVFLDLLIGWGVNLKMKGDKTWVNLYNV